MSKIDVDETVETLASGQLPDWIEAHLREYIDSAGEKGHWWDSTAAGGKGLVPCLLLMTTGRRSGRHYVHPLIYGRDGERFVIVGSKGGADTQPGWYFNLLAEPRATVQVASDRMQVNARVAGGEERERLWAMMADVFPPYINYQAKTSREIPIVVLEPDVD